MLSFEMAGGKAPPSEWRMRRRLVAHLQQSRRRQEPRHPSGDHDPISASSPISASALGIGPGLLRLSVGLEDPEDLIEDLAHALDKAAAPARGGIKRGATLAERAALRVVISTYLSNSASVGIRPFGVR